MARIVGCKEAHELTLCPQGANQHAHTLMRKSMPTQKRAGTPAEPTAPNPSETKMEPAAVAALIGKSIQWDDVTKSHYAGLKADLQPAFLEKSVEDQKAEALASKQRVDQAAADLVAAEQAKTTDIGKAIAEHPILKALMERVEKSEGIAMDAQLREKALTEFVGYPGGTDAAVSMLKSINAMPAENREAMQEAMKAQIRLAKTTTKSLGKPTDGTQANASARDKMVAKANEVVKTKSISFDSAMLQVAQDPANADLMMQFEEDSLQHPAAA